MNDRATPETPRRSEGHTEGGSAAPLDAHGHASDDVNLDMKAVLCAVADRLDEVLAVPGAARPEEAREGHDPLAHEVLDDRTRPDEAEQRLRAARERMTQRQAAAREAGVPSTTDAGLVSRGARGITWTAVGLVAIGAAAALVIIWLR